MEHLSQDTEQLSLAEDDPNLYDFYTNKFITRSKLHVGRKWGFAIVRPSTLRTSHTEEQWEAILSSIRKDFCVEFGYADKSRPKDDAMLPVRRLKMVVLDMEMPHGHSGIADDEMINAARSTFNRWKDNLVDIERQAETKDLLDRGLVPADKTEGPALEEYIRGITCDHFEISDGLPQDIFLLVDSEAMDSILAGDQRAPTQRGWDRKLLPWVLAIDALHVPGTRLVRYYGWMRVILLELHSFYHNISGIKGYFEVICPVPWADGQIPIYAEGEEDFADPPGGVPPRPPTQRGNTRGLADQSNFGNR